MKSKIKGNFKEEKEIDADEIFFDYVFNKPFVLMHVSDVEFLKTAGRCSKLREWLKKEEPEEDVSHLMHFAYWLGRIDGKRRMRVNENLFARP